jgi:C1A family cysteine protease
MFSLFLLSLLFSLSNAFLSEEAYQGYFNDFVEEYNKEYHSKERNIRYNIFKDNMNLIRQHNSRNNTWTMEMNEFGDMTWSEVHKPCLDVQSSLGMWYGKYNYIPSSNLPESVDWTNKGAVTPIKNQKQCGSCWSFSVTGGVEGYNFIKTGKLTSLSEQQLVDCSTSYGNNGCNGGLMDDGFKYVVKNGLCKETDYPYTASQNQCELSVRQNCHPVYISGFKNVNPNDEEQLKSAVVSQPVSVAIEADKMGFQFYSKGIFSGTCGTNLDHGVLLVGYGTDNGQDFWKVKNSWGSTWGDKGYIKLARNVENTKGQCGITMMASYPV